MRWDRHIASWGLAAVAAVGIALPAPADELTIGSKGPDFKLLNVDGKEWTLAQVATGKDGNPASATAIVFM